MTASTVDATARVSEPGRTALRRFRLDFTFDDEAFELKSGEEDIGENVVVGGANRWAYNTFVNYETFPKGWGRAHPRLFQGDADARVAVGRRAGRDGEQRGLRFSPNQISNARRTRRFQRVGAHKVLVRRHRQRAYKRTVRGGNNIPRAICTLERIKTDEFTARGGLAAFRKERITTVFSMSIIRRGLRSGTSTILHAASLISHE